MYIKYDFKNNNFRLNLITIVWNVSFASNVEGMVTVGHMMSQVMKGQVKASDPVSKVIYKQFKQVGSVAHLLIFVI